MNIGPRFILFIRFLVLLMVSQQAMAATPLLRAVVPEDFPPFYYQDSEGDYRGVSYEVARHVMDNLGYQMEITQMASMRLVLKALKDGQQDFSFNLTATEERLESAFFTQTPHVFEAQHFIVRADSTITFDGNLKTLIDYKFGPIFGWTYGASFDRATYLQKAYVNESTQQLKQLLSGRYDIAINNPQYFQNIASSLGVSNAFRPLEPALLKLPVTMAVSRKYPQAVELINAFENELQRFIGTQAYRDILSRYGFDVSEQSTVQKP